VGGKEVARKTISFRTYMCLAFSFPRGATPSHRGAMGNKEFE
jgi:hypothetical protein